MIIKGKIYIPFLAYPYWKERFDININDDYPLDQERKIENILEKEKITECERLILESWIRT